MKISWLMCLTPKLFVRFEVVAERKAEDWRTDGSRNIFIRRKWILYYLVFKIPRFQIRFACKLIEIIVPCHLNGESIFSKWQIRFWLLVLIFIWPEFEFEGTWRSQELKGLKPTSEGRTSNRKSNLTWSSYSSIGDTF